MVRPLSILTFVAFLGALFAGCIGSDDSVDPSTEDSIPQDADQAEATATTGSLTGTVSSDLFEPLGGAMVSLVESADETKVSRAGTFTINDIEPGTYTMFIVAVGYNSLSRRVDITAGEVTRVTMQLTPLPSDDPWVDSREYVGNLRYAAAWQAELPGAGCTVVDVPNVYTVKNCGGLRSGASINGEVKINVTDDSKTVMSEMVWDPAGPLGEYLQMDMMCPEVPRGSGGGAVLDLDHVCYFATTSATSPIVHRVDESHWLEHGYNITGDWASRVFAQYGMLGTYDIAQIDAGVAYEQPFTIYTSVFHKAGAPEGYSGIPDN